VKLLSRKPFWLAYIGEQRVQSKRGNASWQQ